jgi:hypothetical protein
MGSGYPLEGKSGSSNLQEAKMRRGMDKTLAAIACAVIIGALGAMSWNGDQELGMQVLDMPSCSDNAGARDEIINEIEKFNSIWRNHDKGTGSREGAQGNS